MHADFEVRVSALAEAASAMLRTSNGGIAFADLVGNCLAPFGFAPGAGRIAVEGPDFVLREEAIVAFTLALHELATNASKYGALKQGDGRVTLAWRFTTDAGPMFHLGWVESGGPAVTTPAARGFGSNLIETNLAGQLNGKSPIVFAPAGLRAEVLASSQQVNHVAPLQTA